MILHTEKEILTQNEHFTFRLRNLYLKDENLFHQFKDFVSLPFYINERDTFNYKLFSNLFFSKGKEIEDLFEIGHRYLSKISEPMLLNLARKKAKNFHLKDDNDSICSYLQCISLNNKMTHFVSNKCIIDDKLTINTSLFPDQMGAASKLFNSILPQSKNCLIFWQRFQSLTKQEKIILKMIGNGFTNKNISDQLFISNHTVITHRRNIYIKLEINNVAEAVKFSLVMDLL